MICLTEKAINPGIFKETRVRGRIWTLRTLLLELKDTSIGVMALSSFVKIFVEGAVICSTKGINVA